MPGRISIERARARPSALALLLLVIGAAALTSLTAVMMLSPALLLLALLLAGRTPGEDLILRLRSRGRRPRRRALAPSVRGYVALFVRWSERASASPLAGRAPPARVSSIG